MREENFVNNVCQVFFVLCLCTMKLSTLSNAYLYNNFYSHFYTNFHKSQTRKTFNFKSVYINNFLTRVKLRIVIINTLICRTFS